TGTTPRQGRCDGLVAVRSCRSVAARRQGGSAWLVPVPDAPPPPRPSRSRRGRVAAGNALRRRTREVVRASDPPTDPIPLWTQPDGVDVSTGRAVVDLAVRVGVALMATGAAASDVVGSVLQLTA